MFTRLSVLLLCICWINTYNNIVAKSCFVTKLIKVIQEIYELYSTFIRAGTILSESLYSRGSFTHVPFSSDGCVTCSKQNCYVQLSIQCIKRPKKKPPLRCRWRLYHSSRTLANAAFRRTYILPLCPHSRLLELCQATWMVNKLSVHPEVVWKVQTQILKEKYFFGRRTYVQHK